MDFKRLLLFSTTLKLLYIIKARTRLLILSKILTIRFIQTRWTRFRIKTKGIWINGVAFIQIGTSTQLLLVIFEQKVERMINNFVFVIHNLLISSWQISWTAQALQLYNQVFTKLIVKVYLLGNGSCWYDWEHVGDKKINLFSFSRFSNCQADAFPCLRVSPSSISKWWMIFVYVVVLSI